MNGIDLTNLGVVLAWLAGAGGPYVVGRVVALLAENWPKWHTLPRAVKVIAPMVVSILVAALATYLLQQPTLVSDVSQWFTLAMTAALGYLGTQDGYMAARSADYARAAREQ